MQKKLLKVNADTHKKIKIQASKKDMTIIEYVDYIAELHEESLNQSIEDYIEAIRLFKNYNKEKDELIIKGLNMARGIIEGHEVFSKDYIRSGND